MTLFFLITEIAKYPFVDYNKRSITFYMIFFFFLGGVMIQETELRQE